MTKGKEFTLAFFSIFFSGSAITCGVIISLFSWKIIFNIIGIMLSIVGGYFLESYRRT